MQCNRGAFEITRRTRSHINKIQVFESHARSRPLTPDRDSAHTSRGRISFVGKTIKNTFSSVTFGD